MRTLIELEAFHEIGQRAGLDRQAISSSRRLLRGGSVLLHDLVHIQHGQTDLLDGAGLLFRALGDFGDDVGYFARRGDDLRQVLAHFLRDGLTLAGQLQRPDYRRTRRQRKQVEMLFAHMKRILKMDRLRLRGISGARDEFLLTATAQNLRRMTKYLGTDLPAARASRVF